MNEHIGPTPHLFLTLANDYLRQVQILVSFGVQGVTRGTSSLRIQNGGLNIVCDIEQQPRP